MRKGFVYAGAASLVIGLVVFMLAVVGGSQAAAAFLSCLNGYPSPPMFGVPTACADAVGAMALYQGLEILGGAVGLIGFIVLIVGIVLEPERPAVAPMYPAPVYTPYGMPPQGPPPPQP